MTQQRFRQPVQDSVKSKFDVQGQMKSTVGVYWMLSWTAVVFVPERKTVQKIHDFQPLLRVYNHVLTR